MVLGIGWAGLLCTAAVLLGVQWLVQAWQLLAAFLLGRLLSRLCGKAGNVRVRLWKGTLLLQNLCLIPAVVDRLDLPIRCHQATIREVEICIPWCKLGRRPMTCSVEGVCVEMRLRDLPQHQDTRGDAHKLRTRIASTRLVMLEHMDRLFLGPIRRRPAGMCSSLFRAVLQMAVQLLFGNIQLSLSELMFRVVIDSNDVAQALSGLGERGGHPQLELQVGSLRWGSRLASFVGRCLESSLQLDGILCTVSSSAEPTAEHVLLRRWNIRGGLRWKPGGLPVAGGSAAAAHPVEVTLNAGAILLVMDRYSVGVLLATFRCLAEYAKFTRYRSRRPAATVRAKPRAWWRHAGHCVMRDLRALEPADFNKSHRQRCRQRTAYRRLLARAWAKGSAAMGAGCAGVGQAFHRRLAGLEDCMMLTDVLACRWYWLLLADGCAKGSGRPVPAKAVEQLEAAFDNHRLPPASGPRLNGAEVGFTVDCPKVQFALQGLAPSTDHVLQCSLGHLRLGASIRDGRKEVNSTVSSMRLWCPSQAHLGPSGSSSDDPDPGVALLRSQPSGNESTWVSLQARVGETEDSASEGCRVSVGAIEALYAPVHVLRAANFASDVLLQGKLSRFMLTTSPTLRQLLADSAPSLEKRLPARLSSLQVAATLTGLHVVVPCDDTPLAPDGTPAARPGRHLMLRVTDVQVSSGRCRPLLRVSQECPEDSIPPRAPHSSANGTRSQPNEQSVNGTSDSKEPSLSWVESHSETWGLSNVEASLVMQVSICGTSRPEVVEVLSPVAVKSSLRTALAGQPQGWNQILVETQVSTGDVNACLSPYTVSHIVSLASHLGSSHLELGQVLRGSVATETAATEGDGVAKPAVPKATGQATSSSVLKAFLPSLSIKVVQTPGASITVADRYVIGLNVDRVEVSLAAERGHREIRYLVGSVSVVAPDRSRGPGARSASVLVPLIPERVHSAWVNPMRRLRVAFVAWRLSAVGSTRAARRASSATQHLRTHGHPGQVSGMLTVDAARRCLGGYVHSSLVIVAPDLNMLERFQEFMVGMYKLQGEDAARAHALGAQSASVGSTQAPGPPSTTSHRPPAWEVSMHTEVSCVRLLLTTQRRPLVAVALDEVHVTTALTPVKVNESVGWRSSLLLKGSISNLMVVDRLCPRKCYSQVFGSRGSTEREGRGCMLSLTCQTSWTVAQPDGAPYSTTQGSEYGSEDGSTVNQSRRSTQSYNTRPETCFQKTLLRVHVSSLHVVFLCRFLVDVLHIGRAVKMAVKTVNTARQAAGKEDDDGLQSTLPSPSASVFTCQAFLSDVTVDIPRHTLSDEFYTLALDRCELLLPMSIAGIIRYRESQASVPLSGRRQRKAAEEELQGSMRKHVRTKPDFPSRTRMGPGRSAPNSPAHRLKRSSSPVGEGLSSPGQSPNRLQQDEPEWLLPLLSVARVQCPQRRWLAMGLSGPATASSKPMNLPDIPIPLLAAFKQKPGSGEHNVIAADITGTIRIFWTEISETPDPERYAIRQVATLDSVTVGVITGETTHVKIVCPEVACVFGEIQYSLLMAVVFENLGEAPLLAPPRPPVFGKPGTAYPPPVPLSGVLGVAPGVSPIWEVEVLVKTFNGAVESPPMDGRVDIPGAGQDLAHISLSHLGVTVSGHRCGAVRVEVSSSGITAVDVRSSQVQFSLPTKVISIEPKSTWHTSTSPVGRWVMIQDLHRRDTSRQGGAASDPAPLVSSSIIGKSPQDILRGVSGERSQWARPNEGLPDEQPATFRGSWRGSDPGGMDMQPLASPGMEHKAFRVEYVLQPGSHLVEVALQHADLSWPYLLSLQLVWDIVEVYSKYFYSPTCAPHPPAEGPQRWFFVNVILANSKASVFLPSDLGFQGPGQRLGGPAHSGVALNLSCCRVGYSWGGDREAALHVDLSCQDGTMVLDKSDRAGNEPMSQILNSFDAKFETVWHSPSQTKMASMVMQLSTTQLEIRLPFSAVPLIRRASVLLVADGPGQQDRRADKAPEEQGDSEGTNSPSSRVHWGERRSDPDMHETDDDEAGPSGVATEGPPDPLGHQDDALVHQPQGVQRLRRAVIQVDACKVILVDTRYGLNIDVLEAAVHNLAARLGAEDIVTCHEAGVDDPPAVSEMVANLSMQTEVRFLNSAMDVMEPLVDAWPVTCELRRGRGNSSLFLTSEERFNACLAPSSFRSIGDALAFIDELNDPGTAVEAQPIPPNHSPLRMLRQRLSLDLVRRDQDEASVMQSMYVLKNRSGIRLSYWIGNDEQGHGAAYSLAHGEDSPLLVEPELQNVTLPESGQSVRARTICMQFEGAWTPLTKVIVDKAGMYGYQVDSHLLRNGGVMPVVMTVEPAIRRKILTVHSPFEIRNMTPQAVDCIFRMAAGQLRSGTNSALSAPLSSTIPPAHANFLPVPAGAGGHLKVRAHGYSTADKDVIHVGLSEEDNLFEQQGIIACPTMHGEGAPFHCCLEVQKTDIKVFGGAKEDKSWAAGGSTNRQLPKSKRQMMARNIISHYALSLKAPITIANLLPYAISVQVYESHQLEAAQRYDIQPGGSASVCCFDMMHRVKMTVAVTSQFGPAQVTYSSEVPILIHYPIMSFLDKHRQKGAQSGKTRRLPGLKDLPDLRLPRDAKLVALPNQQSRVVSATNVPTTGLTSHGSNVSSLLGSMRDVSLDLPPRHSRAASGAWVPGPKANTRHTVPSITLGIANQLNPASSTRKIALHCPYWLVNVSSIPVQCRDGSAKAPTVVPPYGGMGLPVPVMLGSDKSSIQVATFPGTSWSRHLQLDNVGIKGSISLVEEIRPDADEDDEGMMEPDSRRGSMYMDAIRSPLIVPRRRTTRHSRRHIEKFARASRGVIQAGKSFATWRPPSNPRSGRLSRHGSSVALSDVTGPDSATATAPSSPFSQADDSTNASIVDSYTVNDADDDSDTSEPEGLEPAGEASAAEGGTVKRRQTFFQKIKKDSLKTKVVKMYRRYEFVVQISVAPSMFTLTRIVTISPRFLLLNNTDHPLLVGQLDAHAVNLGPLEHCPFHWELADGVQELRVRPAPTGPSTTWDWSGSFRIDEAGDFGVLVRGMYNPKRVKIINIDVALKGTSVLVTFTEGDEQASPYRVENRSDRVTVEFQQREVSRDNALGEHLGPGQLMRYAWEEPMLPHRLRVTFKLKSDTDRVEMATREYNLDDIKAHPAVVLRPVGDRKLTSTARRLEEKVRKNLPSEKMRDAETAGENSTVVYAAVVADGPTRVLYFTDTRDAFAGETDEERFKAMSKQLDDLEQELQGVDRQLEDLQQVLQESHGISLELGLGQRYRQTLPTASPDGSDDADAHQTNGKADPSLGRGPGHHRSLSTPHAMLEAPFTPPKRPFERDDSIAEEMEQLDTPQGAFTPPVDAIARSSVKRGLSVKVPNSESPFMPGKNQTPPSPVGRASFKQSISAIFHKRSASLISRPSSTVSGSQFVRHGSAPLETDQGSEASTSNSAPKQSGCFGMARPPSPPRPHGGAGWAANPTYDGGASFSASRMTVASPPRAQAGCWSSAKDVSAQHQASRGDEMPPSTSMRNAMRSISEMEKGFSATGFDRLAPRRQSSADASYSTSFPDLPIAPLDWGVTEPMMSSRVSRGSSSVVAEVDPELNSYINDQQDILGGELVVRVMCAENLASVKQSKRLSMHPERQNMGKMLKKSLKASSRLKPWESAEIATDEPDAIDLSGSANQMPGEKGIFKAAELESYVVLECQGQMRRTATASKAKRPTWDEEVTFKSVQIESELKVTVWGKNKLFRSDVFLGQVIIPLSDLQENTDTLEDACTYDLSRKARERVTGRIKLSSMWRITRLDVVTLKLRAKQTELDDKQEVIALLQDRYNLSASCLELEHPAGDQRPAVGTANYDVMQNDLFETHDQPSKRFGDGEYAVAPQLATEPLHNESTSPRPICGESGVHTSPRPKSPAGQAALCKSPLPQVTGVGMAGQAGNSSYSSQVGIDDDSRTDVETTQSTGLGGGASARDAAKHHQNGLPDRTWMKMAGQLDVKVMEARNLAVVTDVMNTFQSMDIYALVICESHSGQQTHQTEMRRNTISPVWNEDTAFDDVATTDTLTVQLFDHKKFVNDVCLGQVRVPVMDFVDCKPHYRWLKLERRSAKDKAKLSGGDIHLRVQLKSNRQFQATVGSSSIQVSLQGIGISVVETNTIKQSRELVHCLLEDIQMDYRRTDHEESVLLAIHTLQVDNQLMSSQQPVVLSAAGHASEHHLGSTAGGNPEGDEHAGAGRPKRPVFEVTYVRSLADPSTLYLQYFTVLLQELNLVLEEEFLDLVIRWVRDLPLSDIWQSGDVDAADSAADKDARDSIQLQEGRAPAHKQAIQAMQEVLKSLVGPTAIRQRSDRVAATIETEKWYFEVLHIQPLKINLTVLPSAGLHAGGVPQLFRNASHLGVQLVDINNVELRINQLALKNAFVRPTALVNQITRHMAFNVLSEIYKILGRVELVGAPVSLISSLGTGVVDFFYEPAKGIVHGPDEFARGVATGTVSLIKNSAYGIFHTVGQVTGGMSKGLAILSMDRQYMQRFRRRPVSVQEGILQGAQDLGVGIYEGFTGVVTDPMRGAEAAGVKGFLKGLATGVTGVVVKPTAGLLEFASKAVSGIGGGIKSWGDETTTLQMRQRVRSPRNYGMSPTHIDGSLHLPEWQELLLSLSSTARYMADSVSDFLHIKHDRVVVFTDQRILYVNLAKRRCVWEVKAENLAHSTPDGLSVHLVAKDRLKIMGKKSHKGLTVPVRHTVCCSSRDTHQALVLKIGSFIALNQKKVLLLSSRQTMRVTEEGSQVLQMYPSAMSSEFQGASESGAEHLDVAGAPASADTPSTMATCVIHRHKEQLQPSMGASSSGSAASTPPGRSSGRQAQTPSGLASVSSAAPTCHERLPAVRRLVIPEAPYTDSSEALVSTPDSVPTSAAYGRDEAEHSVLQHIASLRVLIQLAQDSVLSPEEAVGHLDSMKGLCAIITDQAKQEAQVGSLAPVLPLVVSVRSLCTSVDAPALRDVARMRLVLETLHQLCVSIEQMLKLGRQ